jgi:hypothetical protein
LLYAIAVASLFEIVPVHLLLHRWSPLAAWVATSLSLYAMIWLIGLARSITLQPVVVGPDSVDIRFGLLFRLRIPRDEIASIRGAEPGDTVVPRRSEPNVCLQLRRRMKAEGALGMTRQVDRIALAADEPAEFQRALASMLA